MTKGGKAGQDASSIGAMSGITNNRGKIKPSQPQASLGPTILLQSEGHTVQHAACAGGLAGLDVNAIKNLQ